MQEVINVAKMIGSPSALTREQGGLIFDAIVPKLKDGKIVTLDFGDVESIITPFLNVSIGKLYEKFSSKELEERLRAQNVFNLGDVEYAILETSGQLSVIQKPNKRNTIPEDFNIMPEYEGIPYDLVIDGEIMRENLQKIGKDETWLKKQLEPFKIKSEEALVVTFDGKGNIFCQKKET